MSIFGHTERAEIARLRAEIAELRRRTDDLLDRESMHVYDPDRECLAPAAAIDRYGAARATHQAPATPGRPELKVLTGSVTELEFTAPHIERGVWEGFER